jgi:hypothetical protein
VETFLAGGVPDLITEHAIFKAALLSKECSADCRLFVDLEFVGYLCRSADEREISVIRWESTYKAKDDRGFANGSFAWVIAPVSRRGRVEGNHKGGPCPVEESEKRPTE